jgi:opacity protein-like surface antigen
MTPAWILDSVAALMLATTSVSGARLVLTGPRRDMPALTDTVAGLAYLLTGIAIAGVLAAGLRVLPRSDWTGVFALLTAWFAVQVARDSRARGVREGPANVGLLLLSAAMLYIYGAMATTASGSTAMAGMAAPPAGSVSQAPQYPTLGFVVGLVLIGYTMWDLDRASGRRVGLTGDGTSSGRRSGLLLSSASADYCRIATCVAVSFTLFTTIR